MMATTLAPLDVQLIGTEVAVRWNDGTESFITFATLRANSPSASARGERDIFGHQYGGEAPQDFTGVEVLAWERVGNYAICFAFSDGHNTGLYSYDLLRRLGELPR
ncbi:MAG: gamma-butyrobetaine hydroxylase-like domain-containing protein [Opitutales bacterium]